MDISDNKNKTDRPIAFLDSGVGGISVLREAVHMMPQESFYYYGDSANAPYGTKSTEEVRRLTISHVQRFLEMGAKAVAVACNTATSAAVRKLREMYPDLPIVGIEPALKPAVEQTKDPKVLVMATPMTIREEKFRHLFERFESRAEIFPLPCPGLMEYVENGQYDAPEVATFLNDLLEPYKGMINAVVIGCTHYTFVTPVIERVLGYRVRVFDGAYGTAKELKRRITEAGLLRESTGWSGNVIMDSSDPSPEKIKLCERLLRLP